MKGCQTCDTMKQNGLCKSESCVEISSKTGIQLAKSSKTNTVPQCVTTKNGKVKKCSTTPIIKKFLKKKKK